MGDVTGPISSLPGSLHAVPAGCKCDDHSDRDAVARIQGETDSFGCEMIDMCAECLAEHRSYEKELDRSGSCDWCGLHKPMLRETRDYDEGMCGRLYMVCAECRTRANEEAAAELNAMGWDDLGDWPDDGD